MPNGLFGDDDMTIRMKEPHAQTPRKLASGHWQARVTYYDPNTGKRRQNGKTFTTEREAKKWSREQEVQLRQGTVAPEALISLTVNVLLDRWLKMLRTKPVEESTLESYAARLQDVRAAWGDRLIKDIRRSDVQDLYARVLETHKPRTAEYTATLIRASFKWAVDMEWMLVNPSLKVPKPKVPRTERPVLTPAEAKHILRVASGHRLHALWWFLALTGVRKGEALGLHWADIDWETKTVTIYRTLSGSGRRRRESVPKTKSSARTIAMPDILLQVLSRWKDEQRSQRLSATTWHDTPYVFTTLHGTPWDPSHVSRQFNSLLRQCQLPLGSTPNEWTRHRNARIVNPFHGNG